MTYDHTDTCIPMNPEPFYRPPVPTVVEEEPILGAISYDEDGSVWAYVYPALPCF